MPRNRPMFRINANVNIQVDSVRQFVDALNELTRLEVAVGIPEERAERGGEESGEVNNALIGYVNEYGYPPKNIPARPHLGPGIQDVRDELGEELRGAGDLVFAGKSPRPRFERVGSLARDSVKRKIASNIGPPLKRGTLRARQRRGRRGTKTLQDTGQYRNAITYVVQDRDDSVKAQLGQRAADARRLEREGPKHGSHA